MRPRTTPERSRLVIRQRLARLGRRTDRQREDVWFTLTAEQPGNVLSRRICGAGTSPTLDRPAGDNAEHVAGPLPVQRGGRRCRRLDA